MKYVFLRRSHIEGTTLFRGLRSAIAAYLELGCSENMNEHDEAERTGDKETAQRIRDEYNAD